MVQLAERIKNYVRDHVDVFPAFAFRSQIIRDFYSCKNESDYKLFVATYNKVILDMIY